MRKIDTFQGLKTSFLFAFESREKTLRYWIMVLDLILGKKQGKEVNFDFFQWNFFPFKGNCDCADVIVLFLFYQFYA